MELKWPAIKCRNEMLMRKAILCLGYVIMFLLIIGCTNKDAQRIKVLHVLPALWESTILVANPGMSELQTLVPMSDRYDPNLFEAFSNDWERTEDYIPEAVMAFAQDRFMDKPKEITIRIGDKVAVLAEGKNNTSVPVYLVRTRFNTYAWLYAYHIEDQDGNRIMGVE